ncbi:MAG: hypothetical protein RTU63_07280 [Candidatus Thorarchaeota archaeon]
MYRIGEAKGVKLNAPKDAYFSYFNSPYFGHSHISAIDIYPHHQEWGGPVTSPIAGKIVRTQKTAMGREKPFPTDDHDFGIAIQPEWSDEVIVRVLHCEPTLQKGCTVELGDPIGTTIRSRYFNYWTGPHYHIEVMHLDSFPRSTRSYELEIPFLFGARNSREMVTESEFIVSVINEDHIIGYPRDLSHTEIGSYNGISATEDGSKIVGILDGGLSHYKHGGVIGHEHGKQDSLIGLQNLPVGVVQRSLERGSFFTRGPSLSSTLDGKELRGLSCFVYPKKYNKQGIPPLVLVPKRYRQFIETISEGDVCMLKLNSANNMVKAE